MVIIQRVGIARITHKVGAFAFLIPAVKGIAVSGGRPQCDGGRRRPVSDHKVNAVCLCGQIGYGRLIIKRADIAGNHLRLIKFYIFKGNAIVPAKHTEQEPFIHSRPARDAKRPDDGIMLVIGRQRMSDITVGIAAVYTIGGVRGGTLQITAVAVEIVDQLAAALCVKFQNVLFSCSKRLRRSPFFDIGILTGRQIAAAAGILRRFVNNDFCGAHPVFERIGRRIGRICAAGIVVIIRQDILAGKCVFRKILGIIVGVRLIVHVAAGSAVAPEINRIRIGFPNGINRVIIAHINRICSRTRSCRNSPTFKGIARSACGAGKRVGLVGTNRYPLCCGVRPGISCIVVCIIAAVWIHNDLGLKCRKRAIQICGKRTRITAVHLGQSKDRSFECALQCSPFIVCISIKIAACDITGRNPVYTEGRHLFYCTLYGCAKSTLIILGSMK